MNTPFSTSTCQSIALVTGASRGIGAAIARQLANDGFYVIGTATTPAGAEKITTELDGNGIGKVLDVRNSAQIESLINEIEEQFSSVSVLVNNAGITKDGLLMRMADEAWDDIMQTHLFAVFQLSKRVMRNMAKQRFGRIINISSVVARMGNAGQTNYAAAKAGIEGFTRALAKEVGGRNVTVNSIAPGMIETDMTHELDETQRKKMLDQIPLNRFGTPEDIAMAVSFLAGSSGSYITGATLPVNGGMYLN